MNTKYLSKSEDNLEQILSEYMTVLKVLPTF